MCIRDRYDFGSDVAGFQFDVSGLALSGASGGAAGDAGFTVQTSSSSGVVIGFDFSGATVAAGSGVLTTLEVQGDTSGLTLSDGVLSDSSGSTLNATLDTSGFVYCSADADEDGTCDGLDDCVGAFDECGVCNGDGPVENFDCDGNCVVDTDCAGECGGTSAEDDCGVCNGDNACHVGSLTLGAFDGPGGTLEVLYDFGSDVAGFQFEVSGLTLTGGSGGAAGDAGFDVQTGGGTVIGFSFTGGSIPAGSGVLTVLSFTDVTADLTEISIGNLGAITGPTGTVYASSASGSVDHSGTQDCSGDYYGSATTDNCGTCDSDSSNDCIQDCAGTWGGDAWESDCGCVAADNSGDDCDDCAGTPNGDALVLSLIHI